MLWSQNVVVYRLHQNYSVYWLDSLKKCIDVEEFVAVSNDEVTLSRKTFSGRRNRVQEKCENKMLYKQLYWSSTNYFVTELLYKSR